MKSSRQKKMAKSKSTIICPQCGKPIEGFPALSRRDNKTHICSDCGTREAIADFVVSKYNRTWEDLEAWGERELIEYIIKLQDELVNIIQDI